MDDDAFDAPMAPQDPAMVVVTAAGLRVGAGLAAHERPGVFDLPRPLWSPHASKRHVERR